MISEGTSIIIAGAKKEEKGESLVVTLPSKKGNCYVFTVEWAAF
jgi:hypothetical protein